MRDFTKSVFSFSWALSLFGVQQTLNLMRPSKASQAFDNVTEATKQEMGDALKATLKAGDNLQRGLVDLTLGVFTGQAFNPSRLMRMTSDMLNQSAEAIGQSMRAATSGGKPGSPGWCPMPDNPRGLAQDGSATGRPGPGTSAVQG